MIDVPKVELTALRKLSPGDVRLLWVNDWYEGPLEAMVEHGGERCLMVLLERPGAAPIPDDADLRWLLVRLTPVQRAEEASWHALFAEHVGEHWCFHPETPHDFPEGITRDPQLFWGPFARRPKVDLSQNDVAGWLDELPKS
jgi:hypothetical protein